MVRYRDSLNGVATNGVPLPKYFFTSGNLSSAGCNRHRDDRKRRGETQTHTARHRDSERDRERQRHTETARDTQTHRHTDTQRQRVAGKDRECRF